MLELANKFRLDGNPIFFYPFGKGHINETYLLVDSTAREYILQRINGNVFHEREALMKNVAAITAHLRLSSKSSREVLTLIPTKSGDAYFIDDMGEFWRTYAFVSDSICFERSENANVFRESGLAFGRFQRMLADFPPHRLTETIPRFHDTPWRYFALDSAIKADVCGRVKNVGKEIDFSLQREDYAATVTALQASGELPPRVVHNDTKLNNVLFDRDTHKALCVIDLDTAMPGTSVNDFGDSIRFGASTAAEDEPDLSKVTFSMPLFEAFTDGFLTACGESLTPCEAAHLCDGAKMMTLECGVRFLTDYLSGDTYFKIHRENHNLDRCRTQFKLVSDMEKNWTEMSRAVSDRI